MATKQEPIKGKVERAPHYLWKHKANVDLKYDANAGIRAQYEAAVRQQTVAEDHAKRSDVARRRNRIREQKKRAQCRKVQNYNTEIELGIQTFGRQPPRPPSTAPKEPKHKPVKKDHYFYRRTGFMWTDLVHTPVERAPFAVPASSIVGDVNALEHIVKELEKEDAVVASKEKRVLERVAVLRDKARAKSQATKYKSRALRGQTLASAVEERRELRQHLALQEQLEYEGLSISDPGRLAELAGSLPEQDRSAHSPRLNGLAQPKRHYTKKELFMNVGTGDIRGLIVTDPALSEHVSHVKQIGAEQINDSTLDDRINKVLPHTVTSVMTHLEKNKPGPPTGQKSSAGASPRRRSRSGSQENPAFEADPLQVLAEAGYRIGGNQVDARAVAAAIVNNATESGKYGVPGSHHPGGAQQEGEGPAGTMGLLALNQPSHYGGEELGDDWRLWSHIESRTSLDTGVGAGPGGSQASTATHALMRERQGSNNTLPTRDSLRVPP